MRLPMRVIAMVCAFGMGASGCSKQSVFTLRSGQSVAGEVKRSDGDQIIVETEDGQEVSVDRHQIEDVTWSGEASTIAGVTLVALSVAGIAATLGAFFAIQDSCSNCHGGEVLVLLAGLPSSVAVGVVGIGPLVWGLTRTDDDKTDAEASRSPAIGLAPYPPRNADLQPQGGRLSITR
jgi:hypothetical protein